MRQPARARPTACASASTPCSTSCPTPSTCSPAGGRIERDESERRVVAVAGRSGRRSTPTPMSTGGAAAPTDGPSARSPRASLIGALHGAGLALVVFGAAAAIEVWLTDVPFRDAAAWTWLPGGAAAVAGALLVFSATFLALGSLRGAGPWQLKGLVSRPACRRRGHPSHQRRRRPLPRARRRSPDDRGHRRPGTQRHLGSERQAPSPPRHQRRAGRALPRRARGHVRPRARPPARPGRSPGRRRLQHLGAGARPRDAAAAAAGVLRGRRRVPPRALGPVPLRRRHRRRVRRVDPAAVATAAAVARRHRRRRRLRRRAPQPAPGGAGRAARPAAPPTIGEWCARRAGRSTCGSRPPPTARRRATTTATSTTRSRPPCEQR